MHTVQQNHRHITQGEDMNTEEINEMMSHLPSQQPEEPLLSRWIVGTMFILFVIAVCLVPDIWL
jgi:hypothetical protein